MISFCIPPELVKIAHRAHANWRLSHRPLGITLQQLALCCFLQSPHIPSTPKKWHTRGHTRKTHGLEDNIFFYKPPPNTQRILTFLLEVRYLFRGKPRSEHYGYFVTLSTLFPNNIPNGRTTNTTHKTTIHKLLQLFYDQQGSIQPYYSSLVT